MEGKTDGEVTRFYCVPLQLVLMRPHLRKRKSTLWIPQVDFSTLPKTSCERVIR